jgi:hypothetical protein
VTLFYVELSDDDAEDVASGYVPTAIKAQVRAMLDWRREDERRAARPVRPSRQPKGEQHGKAVSD